MPRKLFFASFVASLFLLHFDGWKITLFDIPFPLVEIATLFALSLFFFSYKKRERLPRWILFSFFFLFFGLITSLLAAKFRYTPCELSRENFLHGLGIIKSWFFFPILFGWIVFQVREKKFFRENILFILTLSFLPITLLSITSGIFGRGMTYDHRLAGIFSSPNLLAISLAPACFFSYSLFLSLRERKKNRLLLFSLGMFFLFLGTLFFTKSYSAWIALSIGFLFFEIARHSLFQKKIFSSFAICISLILLAGVSQYDNPRFHDFWNPASRSSFASRVMIWNASAKMLADSLFFGIGPGNFQSCYLEYQTYFPPYLEWSVPEPHNLFLAFWLGSGAVGLLSFLTLLFFWFRDVKKRIQKKEGNILLLLTLAAIFIATLVHGLFDTPYWKESFAYLFWVVFFLGVSRENKSSKQTHPKKRIFLDFRV